MLKDGMYKKSNLKQALVGIRDGDLAY